MMQPKHGGNIDWAVGLAGCSASMLLDFSASISPLGPPQTMVEAIQAGISQLSTYPNPEYPQLKDCLAAWHELDGEWVLPGNGAAELITWAGRELARMSRAFVLTPGFADYRRSLQAFDASIQPYPLKISAGPTEFGKEGSALHGLAHRLDASCGLLLNNPHNPTGQMFLRQEIRPLLATGALVVVDEAFMDFVTPQKQQSVIDWVKQYDNLIVLRSLTKFYRLPGLRMGYALGHPDRLRRWQQWRDPWPVNGLAAVAAQAAVQAKDFQQETWNWLEPAKQQLFTELNEISGLKPRWGAANFLLVQCEQSVTALQKQLLKHHRILIRDCMSFEELGDRYFRVAVRLPEENERLVAALKQELLLHNVT